MIESLNAVSIFEDHGVEIPFGNRKLKIESHFRSPDRVVLSIGNERVTVLTKELLAAIQNATNVARKTDFDAFRPWMES